jgi:hypothetical protein
VVRRFNQLVVQHEAAHHVLFHLGIHVRGVDNPMWLLEGLACQFEVAQIDGVAGALRVNQTRLTDFREALSLPAGRKSVVDADLQEARRNGRWLPLKELATINKVWEKPADQVVFRYAQAWGLAYYLARERSEDFRRYLLRCAQRKPGVAIDEATELAEFEAAFGPLNDRLERIWVEYIAALEVDPRQD